MDRRLQLALLSSFTPGWAFVLLAWLRVTSGIFTLTLFVLAFMSAWLSFRFYRSQVIEPLRFGILVFIAFFVPMMYLLFFRTLFSHLFAR